MVVIAIAEHPCCLISKICPVFPFTGEKSKGIYMLSAAAKAARDVLHTTFKALRPIGSIY